MFGGAAGGLKRGEGGAVLIEQAGEALLVEAELREVRRGGRGRGEDGGFERGDALQAPVLGDDGFGEGGFIGAGGGEMREHFGAELFEDAGILGGQEYEFAAGEAVRQSVGAVDFGPAGLRQ